MLQLEKKRFKTFVTGFQYGAFKGQRLGQAFYNAFQLEKLADQAYLEDLYEKDGEEAHAMIHRLFTFN